MKKEENKMEKIVSLCKRRGFIFQGSEIYGGLAGTWDFVHLGLILKNNIKEIWWKRFVLDRKDMYGVDAAILMNQNVWKASGHVSGFSDPLVEEGKTRQFNMMFTTNVGVIEDEDSISYLRPETAQGMFVNFKNALDSFHPTIPFGLAQIGKAFRNEIAPRDFVFRAREFEQMEIEYFVKPLEWEKSFEHFREEMHAFMDDIGLDKRHIHELDVPDGERAHYSKRTIDFEFDFPFGKRELYGLAYRADFDLVQHAKASTVDLSYYDEDTKERYVPHCIEPSFGVERSVLAVLSDAYTEDEIDGEKRVYLKLKPNIAPVKVAVFPLLKNKPALVEKAREIYGNLKKEIGQVEFDDNGNIGKRYRRQDEIGTPYCVTIDFDTIEKEAGVTVRDRDSGKQERVKIEDLSRYIKV
ncbi:MAG TPA: glycine--tRNA ligase [Candidatus Paceibacterota bacterium]